MSEFEPRFEASTYEKAKEQIKGVDTPSLDEIIAKNRVTMENIRSKEAPTRIADKKEAADILDKFFGKFPDSISTSQAFNNAIKEYAPKLGERVDLLAKKYKGVVAQLLNRGNPQENIPSPQMRNQPTSATNSTIDASTSQQETIGDTDPRKQETELLSKLEGTTIKALGKEIPLNPNELALEDKGDGTFIIKSNNPKFSYIKTELLIDKNGILQNKQIKIDAGFPGKIIGANGEYTVSQNGKSVQLNKIG